MFRKLAPATNSFQGRRADLLGAACWCSAVHSTVHTHRRHPVSTKTSVL